MKRKYIYISTLLFVAYCYLSSIFAAHSNHFWKYGEGGDIGAYFEFDDSLYSLSWPIIYKNNERIGYIIVYLWYLDYLVIYSDKDKEFGLYHMK